MDDREVDVGLCNHIEQVGEDILGGDGDDLDDLTIRETGVAHIIDGGWTL